MSDQASVQSFDAVRLVKEELMKFGHRCDDGLVELEGEIRRVIDWVEHDRPGYWKERVRRAHDEVTEAKNALHRCMMYPINDEQPSCTEERAALKKAEAVLANAREKQERVRHWARTLRHELHEYQGRVGHLKQAIELDIPKSVKRLNRTLDALEKYAQASIAPSSTPTSGNQSASDSKPGKPGEKGKSDDSENNDASNEEPKS